MRAMNGSRHWIAAVIFFSVLYWIFKAERQYSFSDNAWTSKYLGGGALSSEYVVPKVEQEPLPKSGSVIPVPEVISKAHPHVLNSLPAEIPKLIWQTSDVEGAKRWANNTATWTTKSPNWEYNLLSDEGATAFVFEHFRHRPSVVEFWTNLRQIVLRADMIRYLAMLARGGVYSDMDTSLLKPIDGWIPKDLRHKNISAVVSLEYDDTTYRMFVRPISFCQWTLMAKPGHAIFERAVQRVMSNLEYVARRKRMLLRELELNKMEVLEATGPGMFTDVVMEVLRDQTESVNWNMFHNMKKPKLVGDVLVLPVRGFASGQKHSHSKDKAYGEALVKHHFGRSWYDPQVQSLPENIEKEEVKEQLPKNATINMPFASQNSTAEIEPLTTDDQPDEAVLLAEELDDATTKEAAQEIEQLKQEDASKKHSQFEEAEQLKEEEEQKEDEQMKEAEQLIDEEHLTEEEQTSKEAQILEEERLKEEGDAKEDKQIEAEEQLDEPMVREGYVDDGAAVADAQYEKQLYGTTPSGAEKPDSPSNEGANPEEQADRTTLNVEEVGDKSSEEMTTAEEKSGSVIPNIEEVNEPGSEGRTRR